MVRRQIGQLIVFVCSRFDGRRSTRYLHRLNASLTRSHLLLLLLLLLLLCCRTVHVQLLLLLRPVEHIEYVACLRIGDQLIFGQMVQMLIVRMLIGSHSGRQCCLRFAVNVVQNCCC